MNQLERDMLAGMTSFDILVSDGSEDNGEPTWMVVDDSDCMVAGVPYVEGDAINDAVERMQSAGILPEAIGPPARQTMPDPYSFQPPGLGYRWTINRTNNPTNDKED